MTGAVYSRCGSRSGILGELLATAMGTGGEGGTGGQERSASVVLVATMPTGWACASSGGVGALSEARNTAIPDAPDDTGRSGLVHRWDLHPSTPATVAIKASMLIISDPPGRG